MNKEQFWDGLRLRFNWTLPRIPTDCVCGNKFTVNHALSCKCGGFVTLRHNILRNVTAKLMTEVTKDVRVEPTLAKLTGEKLNNGAKVGDEARLDISALGFWVPGQRVFCDVRVFDHNAQRYRNSDFKKCFIRNEDEKKKHYNTRVFEVENATFTPLVFAVNGGMARECKRFYQRLAELIAIKRDIPIAEIISYIRTNISFALLKSMLLCIRGWRTPNKIANADVAEDIQLAEIASHERFTHYRIYIHIIYYTLTIYWRPHQFNQRR